MEKEKLRALGIENLTWLSQQADLKQAKETASCAQLFQSDSWQQAQTIGITKAMAKEFDTEKIIRQAWREQKQVAVPKVLPKRQLRFLTVTPETVFEAHRFGMLEPISETVVKAEAIDLLFVPGVIFNLAGYRIGFGGGFYDRFLADYTGTTCSMVFSEQIQENWQPEPFDVPVAKLFIG